jgi:hypothetical protein
MISAWSRSAKLLTRYEARRIAANHRQAGGAAAAEARYRTEIYLTYGRDHQVGPEEAVCMRTTALRFRRFRSLPEHFIGDGR